MRSPCPSPARDGGAASPPARRPPPPPPGPASGRRSRTRSRATRRSCHAPDRCLVYGQKTSKGVLIMKVFLAGATGAMGQAMVPQLLAAGHSVTGTTRRQAGADQLRAQGAEPVVVDPFDRAALTKAVI